MVRLGDALLDQTVPCAQYRLQALLLHSLDRRFLDVRSTSGFSNSERIVTVGLVALPERCNSLRRDDACFVPVPLCGARPVVRRGARLKGNQ